ncbi:MAG: TSUP family transporter [Clostridiaceae bacterium]
MITKYLIICIGGFFAAMLDAIAGGGGILSVPALSMIGLSPYFVLGTNKFAASTSSLTSSLSFAFSKKVNMKPLKYLIPFTLIGAFLGVNTVLSINQRYLNVLVIIMILFVGIYSLFSKSMGSEYNFKGLTKINVFWGILLAFSLGFYDGFFGPGTGSFLIFGLIKIFKFDFINASGNAKVLNFVSNITSLVLFAINGKILLIYGIPMAIFMIMGARVGALLALKKGSKIIKPIFITMSLGVAVKMLIDIIL